MPDTESPGGSGPNHGSDLQLINLLVLQIGELIRQTSILTSSLQYNPDFGKTEFLTFYSIFLEVHYLTGSLVSAKLKTRIDTWVKQCSIGKPDGPTRRMGLSISTDLIEELRGLGLMQLFEEPVAPPFMQDFGLEEYEEELAKEELAKEELAKKELAKGKVKA